VLDEALLLRLLHHLARESVLTDQWADN
jgi:hypothetical protein